MKDKNYFLTKAQENYPKLNFTVLTPDISEFTASSGDSVILDLGQHAVGHFSFSFDKVDRFVDAPVCLKIKFGEDMREINDDFSQYNGILSKTWLQEEIINLDYPQKTILPRRYACRYIKITVEKTNRPIRLFDFSFRASTSADESALTPSDTKDELLKKIDLVATNTLKECMQAFFEDGPKRDRRLWIGDLRLEALTNYYTFKNLDIVRRCLYLFAAGECNDIGFLPSFVYETPYYYSGETHIEDYALLYVVSVCDYYEHTGDISVVNDLLQLCKSQLDNFKKTLDKNLITTKQEGWFAFIDWCPGLEILTALQGVYLYTLEHFTKLLETICDDDYEKYASLLPKVRSACKKYLYDEKKNAFINDSDNKQFSVHSQVWMILGGVIDGEEAKNLLLNCLDNKKAKQPCTPYMRHYVIEAMLKLGMKDDAVQYLKNLWGGMVEFGVDTFWEAYVPDDLDFSPYNDRMINSLCHAWSCTPAYFIRKYGL
ncbi:MAG: sugar hydrolase [Oscillospiraceae bacterium]|nr:sugar hydrolase [Oscillospiraceae bacterium]